MEVQEHGQAQSESLLTPRHSHEFKSWPLGPWCCLLRHRQIFSAHRVVHFAGPRFCRIESLLDVRILRAGRRQVNPTPWCFGLAGWVQFAQAQSGPLAVSSMRSYTLFGGSHFVFPRTWHLGRVKRLIFHVRKGHVGWKGSK